jgi:hypothetical protein
MAAKTNCFAKTAYKGAIRGNWLAKEDPTAHSKGPPKKKRKQGEQKKHNPGKKQPTDFFFWRVKLYARRL